MSKELRRDQPRARRRKQAKTDRKYSERPASGAAPRHVVREEPRDPVGGTRHALATAFLKRSVHVLQMLAAKAPANVLEAALAEPDPVGGVAALLLNFAASGSMIDSDPLLEAMARGTALKGQLLSRAGGTWSATQVAEALGISRQAVDKRRGRGALLAVPSGTGDYLYPRVQFSERGPLPQLERVLRAFRVSNPWTQLSALLAPARSLGGNPALEALRKGDVDGAIGAVESVGDSFDDTAPPM